ncbi:MAG TPA: hypothetical protein DCX53_12200 [Anaerolineae bacterium]|nr:hypothetical protein [Anaerolineae bacterium]
MNDKVVIVTAASGAIGRTCARKLAELGYRLVLFSRSDSVKAIASEIGGVSVQGSVTSADDLNKVVGVAIESFGRIDAVLNSTGHATGSSDPTGKRYDPSAEAHLLDISDDDWHRNFDLYFLNVVRMARLVTPHFIHQGEGMIVNISASAAVEPSYAYPSSSTIRSALSGFTKLYADRYARDGIRMNNILPGYLENWEWSESFIDSIPAGRAGSLDEVANVAAFLLSSESSYITGQNIIVDGGYNRAI